MNMNSKTLKRVKLDWKTLAVIDGNLTRRYVDNEQLCTHRIDTHKEGRNSKDEEDVKLFLEEEYKSSMKVVSFQVANYIPSETFSQIGLFLNLDFEKNNLIPGVSGFLSELPDEEHIAGFNDFSLLTTTRNIKTTFLMLGPVSFVNSSCKPNAKYVIDGHIVRCMAIRDIKKGEELTVKYDINFFGNFNKDCLWKYTSEHGDPLENRLPSRKRKLFGGTVNRKLVKTAKNKENCNKKGEPVDLLYRFSKGKILAKGSVDTEDEEETTEIISEISYDELFGSLQSSRASSVSNFLRSYENSFDFSPQHQIVDQPAMCSTPLRQPAVDLQVFEIVESNADDVNEIGDEELGTEFWSNELELFDGSDFSTTEFVDAFHSLADKHILSGIARKDFLKLFSNVLPSPNNVLSASPLPICPSVACFKDNSGDLLTISLHEQLKLVISRNQRLIKQSWETGCLWQTGNVVIGDREILLNVNIDGVALFKSRNLSVWPVWVEIFNLPPKIRGSFGNHVLLCLWRGVGKPDWNFLLKKISIEMELFLQQKFF